MWLVLCLFILVGLWFYPLALLIDYHHGWRVLWLPRLCGGYARPRPAPRLLHRARHTGYELELTLPPRLSRLLLRRLLSHLQLERLRFLLLAGNSSLSCILSLRLGDIILSMLQAGARYLRQQQRGR